MKKVEIFETNIRSLGKELPGKMKGIKSRTESIAEVRNQRFIEIPVCTLPRAPEQNEWMMGSILAVGLVCSL